MSEKMTTSEPSTEEIVQMLRTWVPFAAPCLNELNEWTIDRLESLEREKAALTKTNQSLVLDVERLTNKIRIANEDIKRHEDYQEEQQEKIVALTARAEQAEAREKAAVKDIEAIMSSRGLADYTICEFCRRPDDDTCFIPNDAKKCAAAWRGLPQDGEGKE